MTILYITQRLAAIYDALKPHALYRLTLRENEPDHERQLLAFRLEVVCDTATPRRHRRPCPLTR